MPNFGEGLLSILSLGTIGLAGFARHTVLTCRHHFELKFLAGIPFSLKLQWSGWRGSLECTYSLSRRPRADAASAGVPKMPSCSKCLSILSFGTTRLAGFARLAVLTCRHHFELEFLAGIPFSLKTAFTCESEGERARERQAERERARERERE